MVQDSSGSVCVSVGRGKGESSPAALGAEGKALGGSTGGVLRGAPLLAGLAAFGSPIPLPAHPVAWALLPAQHHRQPPHHHPASKLPAIPLPQGFS